MMRISRLGVFILLLVAVMLGTNCSFYNRVITRKNLVDGSKAYKDRKFPEAERLFRYAASRDPNGETVEGRTAQLSLARTLHSEFIGNRADKAKADDALNEYKKSLPQSLKELQDASASYDRSPAAEDAQKKYLISLSAVNSTTSAISSLYDNLGLPDKAREWQAEVAGKAEYPATARARAYSSLASKQNSCANDISDTEKTKKTVKKDGKDVFEFFKPENGEDFTKLKQCVEEGTKLIEQAVALEPDPVKNSASLNVAALTDTQLALDSEIFKVFESVRSYKASLMAQTMRVAEMEGRTADRDSLKGKYEQAKGEFSSLSDIVKKITGVIDERVAAKEASEKTATAANKANANK